MAKEKKLPTFVMFNNLDADPYLELSREIVISSGWLAFFSDREAECQATLDERSSRVGAVALSLKPGTIPQRNFRVIKRDFPGQELANEAHARRLPLLVVSQQLGAESLIEPENGDLLINSYSWKTFQKKLESWLSVQDK